MPAPSSPPPPWRPRVTAASMAVGAFVAWAHWGGWGWGGAVAVTLSLLGQACFFPRSYAPVFRAMERGTDIAVKGLSWFLLAVVFALVFVPGGVVWRLLGREAIPRRPRASLDTYLREVSPSTGREHFQRQF